MASKAWSCPVDGHDFSGAELDSGQSCWHTLGYHLVWLLAQHDDAWRSRSSWFASSQHPFPLCFYLDRQTMAQQE